MDISSLMGTSQTVGANATEKKSALSQDEFFKIMITELTNQDPLEPLDNSQFLNQVTQMQTLETMTQLSRGIEAMLLGQQVSSAGALIGRVATGFDTQGLEVEGTVDRVLVRDGQVNLGIGDRLLPIGTLTEVKAD